MDNDDQVLQGEDNLDDFFQEEPVPLVIFNEQTKKFELNEDGQQYLTSLKGPIGIIAVAGMYRTGKSYLLNRMLLDRSNGFGVGPTVNACTKGVWMWGKPVQGFTPEGDPINVIILDTEGLGALDEDSNHDVRIFSLAILLSSYFIYNSVGSIDENALQNLSLVINLTKHIQIKSSGVMEDVDPEEYAKYFPSFMWVVRDFTLQLVDTEGESITSKEYLEKALQQQKGFSDSVEQKNRIRRLMKSFFTERDCVTMIRPLIQEDQLQNLINIPMQDLRSEFVDQIYTLRKKVLNRVKPKKINGKELNGDMFWNLMSSYVEAINKGAIPSIESSWAYICKNECLKALDESFDVFCRNFMEEIETGGPFYDQELKDIYNNAKKAALDNFSKVAVGEIRDQYLDDLKEKMKQKYNQIKQDNQQSCQQECIIFLRNSYTEIERALKNQQYPSFIDYLHDVEQLKQIFEENGPPGTNRKETLLEFCNRAVMESAEFFLGNAVNEINLQKTLAEESLRKLQNEIQENKQEQKQKIELLEDKMRKSDIEKAEIGAKEQISREALQQVTTEKNQLETELNGKMSQLKKDYDRQIDDLNDKMLQTDEMKKEIQRQQVSSESEFDKQKALLDQKIEFLEKALEDSNKREKEISLELKNSKKDFLNQNRENTLQLEKQLKDQTRQLDEMKEQIYELENKNSELELHLEEQKNQYQDKIGSMQKELNKSKDCESELDSKYESLKKKYDQECLQLKANSENDKLLNDQRMNELETQLKETQDAFEMGKQNWDKEEAVLKQKLEFVQYQLEDEKKKFEENRLAHDSMLKSLQSSNRESVIGKEEAQTKINEMEQKFMNERKAQEDMYNEYRKKLTNEIELLKKKNNELELAQKVNQGEYEKEMANLKESLSDSEYQKTEALKNLKSLESQKGSLLAENEDRFKQREQELEQLLDDKDKEIDDIIEENNVKSEQKLNELKRFYEEERERLEKRVLDEKSRNEKKMNQAIEDYEDKIAEMNNNHEEAFNALEDDKAASEHNLQNIINQLEKENQIMQQSIENKDKYLNELKENYLSLQDQSSKQNDTQSEKFSRERKDLNEKVDQLTSDVSRKERSILSLENQKEALQAQIQNKEKHIDEIRADQQKEKVALTQKIEDLKQKFDKSMDELTQSKIEFEREKALKDQRLTFQEQRIKEYHDQMTQSIERYEERLKAEKEDANKTMAERIARIQQEKDNVDGKYEQKRKTLKELEKSIQQQQSQYEREKAVMAEKYENLERQLHDQVTKSEEENLKLQEANDQLNQALSQGEIGVRDQIEQWKTQYYEMEKSNQDIQSELEKERALWQGKFDFLERQKDQAKKDNEEAMKQFQLTVDQLQKSQSENKAKHESNHNSILQQIEAKFKKELKESTDNQQEQQQHLTNQVRRLEKENKILIERLELSSKSMMGEQTGLEKKIERVTEERDRLKEDFESLKTEKDKKIDEIKRLFEREKESLKQKNSDLQNKTKNSESKHTELILAHETNRAKWDQEKSFLLSAKEDAITDLKNMQRKYENQVKEIERLKEQSRKNNWRLQNKEKAGGLSSNKMMGQLGGNMMSKLNLGGQTRASGTALNDLTSSQNLGKIGDAIGTYRSNLGTDKSMENVSFGFGQRFGAALNNNQNNPASGAVAGAQPQTSSLGLKLGVATDRISLRQSANILSTPSSNGKKGFEDDE